MHWNICHESSRGLEKCVMKIDTEFLKFEGSLEEFLAFVENAEKVFPKPIFIGDIKNETGMIK